jgi:hypothetical protein
MNSSSLSQPQLIGASVGALFILVLALWICWKITKLLIKTSLALLILATMGGAIWWFFVRR